jgi:glycogen debranching enzyme
VWPVPCEVPYVILRKGMSFVVAGADGDIGDAPGQGLFFEDLRHLSKLIVRINGHSPSLLRAHSEDAEHVTYVLSNNKKIGDLAGHSLLVRRTRHLTGALREQLRIENHAVAACELEIEVELGADFRHVFLAHSATDDTSLRPTAVEPVWVDERRVRFRPRSGKRQRATIVQFRGDTPRSRAADGRVVFEGKLAPRGTWELEIHVETTHAGSAPVPRLGGSQPDGKERQLDGAVRDHPEPPKLEVDLESLRRAYDRAISDIEMLRMHGEHTAHLPVVAAGIPWFIALFGRDSLIAAYEMMIIQPELAKGTLMALARLQGTKTDASTGEQPGKILHEYRHARYEGPGGAWRFPYYGSVDATPLFLIVLSEYVRVTGDLGLAKDLWSHVARALAWIDEHGDLDGDGFIEYESDPETLENQAWKDSHDAYRYSDGRVARAPMSSVEVQGYAIDALERTAELAAALGDVRRAGASSSRASALRSELDACFWMESRAFYAEALDHDKRQVDAITSNPGHLLWSAAVATHRARAVADALAGQDMFTGFGIRTMSRTERAYNPLSYHCGSVWPHDTMLIAEGLARYGVMDAALRIVSGMLDAASLFDDHQLPEVFAGCSRDDLPVPVPYPAANRPQAWASGAIILAVRLIAGITVNALQRRVSVRPLPPMPGLSALAWTGLRIGGARVDAHLESVGGQSHVTLRGLPAGWEIDRSTPRELEHS